MTFCRNFGDEELSLSTTFTVGEIALAKERQQGRNRRLWDQKEDNKTAKTECSGGKKNMELNPPSSKFKIASRKKKRTRVLTFCLADLVI